ncbi:MAG TPA: hypothetical protein PKW49_06330 [Paludibacteraceae bacterium]|nr:hypothetical protein [Paludibacteraceae bacterium]HQF50076.1 hypothetical protein [Paludibacteraceae bacterium]
MRKLFFVLLVMFAFASVQAADLIGIRADNSKETFTISNVMSIKFRVYVDLSG